MHFRPNGFRRKGVTIRTVIYNSLKNPEAQEMPHFFEDGHDIQKNMLLSLDDLGLLAKEEWEGVLKPSNNTCYRFLRYTM